MLTFVAGLNALGPRVIKLRVADVSAILIPCTAARATTAFAGFRNPALGTGT